jgi:formylglycine-generating enzyme
VSGSSSRYVLPFVFVASVGAAAVLVSVGPPPKPAPPASPPPSSSVDDVVSATPAPTESAAVPPATTGDGGGERSGEGGGPAAPAGACPDDMALVSGWFCPFVAHRCKKTRRAKHAGEPEVCEEFKNEVLCEGALERLRYCMDLYEYPNQVGVLPAVLVSFDEAVVACEVEGKRLCEPRELAFACEGEAIHPYPIGEKRDAGACRWDAGPEGRVAPSRGATVAAQLALIDRRAGAGSHAGCRSPFGVFDLAGNVAEWANDPQGSKRQEPFASVIALGAWGSSPSTCRSADASLPPSARNATTGFRCCSGAAIADDERRATPRPRTGGGFRPIGATR